MTESTVRHLSQESLPANRWPLNRLALRWLNEAREPVRVDLPYLPQLLWLGFERNLPVPGAPEREWGSLELAAGQMLDPSLDPLRIMRWFQNNPDGPEESEQSRNLQALLREAKNWEEAAQSLMEIFWDLLSATNPVFRPQEVRV